MAEPVDPRAVGTPSASSALQSALNRLAAAKAEALKGGGKASGVPTGGGTDWSAPLSVGGGASVFAQGPLPVQPPKEVMANGVPRLVPSSPAPRFVPPPSMAYAPSPSSAVNVASQMASSVPPGAATMVVKQPLTPLGSQTVQGQDVGRVDDRIPATMRSLLPGHGTMTNALAFYPRGQEDFNPDAILAASQDAANPGGQVRTTADGYQFRQVIKPDGSIGWQQISTRSGAPYGGGNSATSIPFTANSLIAAHQQFKGVNSNSLARAFAPVTRPPGSTAADMIYGTEGQSYDNSNPNSGYDSDEGRAARIRAFGYA